MTTDRFNQGTVTAVRISPRATRAPGPQFVPLLPSLFHSFILWRVGRATLDLHQGC